MNRRVVSAVLSAVLFLSRGSGAQTTGLRGPQPWLGDRAVGEGIGIRAGNFELHPGVSAEFGFDSNFFQRAASGIERDQFGRPASALRLRVTPHFLLRTLDRRLDTEGQARPRNIAFEAGAQLSYNELFGLRQDSRALFEAARNLQGGGGLSLSILPNRKWSAEAEASYFYVYDPTNQGGLTSDFSRHLLDAGAGLNWAPGGGAFEWQLLRYATRLSLFDQENFAIYNNQRHLFLSSGSWKFLPKTALLFDGEWGLVRYAPGASLNDGGWIQGRLGLNGLVTTRLALSVMMGWASSFYVNQNGMARNYDDFVGNAEASFYITSGEERRRPGFPHVGPSKLSLGYARTFQDGYLGDFFQRDRGYAQLGYLVGGVVLTRVEGGVSLINYPDFLLEGAENPGFSEVRLDLMGFAEYRPMTSVGVNLTVSYDQNFSRVLQAVTYNDDLSFNRFRALLGLRWFL